MASVHKNPKAPRYWYAFFRGPDGKQWQRSTKLPATAANKLAALRLAEGFERALRGDLVREKLLALVDEISAARGEVIEQALSVRDLFARVAGEKRLSVTAGTAEFYRRAADAFLRWLGADADRELSRITRQRLSEYRAHLAEGLAGKTVNHHVKVLRMHFAAALRDGVISSDPAAGLALVKEQKESIRQPFTVEELRRVLAAASGEWRGMILCGLYTGQRLGDIAALSWGSVDFAALGGRGEIRLVTSKTGRRQFIPLHPVLRSCLEALPRTPAGPIFPGAAAAVARGKGKTSALSGQFTAILTAAGLREKEAHRGKRAGPVQLAAAAYGASEATIHRWLSVGRNSQDACPLSSPQQMLQWWSRRMRRPAPAGLVAAVAAYPQGVPGADGPLLSRGSRGHRRAQQGLSFHSLRHTATSLLKAAGVPSAAVMELIGHDDAAISRHYTHTGSAELLRAVDALPDL